MKNLTHRCTTDFITPVVIGKRDHPGNISRVCSAVAIAIVAETCGTFTCIPAILSEYRTAELNVQTGCLKALSFIFEYVGPQSAFYVDPVVTPLEDALTDRDLVHRQTASTIVKHIILRVAGLGCEDSMMHLLSLVWPYCFETSPPMISAVMDAIEAIRATLGPGVLLNYTLQRLFHPARKVREVYWGVCNALCIGAALSCLSGVPTVDIVPRFNYTLLSKFLLVDVAYLA
ncbi:hypothetical protein M407DRAFT_17053 [Tulasnella calospora MUT 4182]|uniref:Phosphatase PP2A regulatory subunit A/Splicing factor 3B subunit 1-like HEAT repeat domain-containing protein n=1 Tax=Tulasnella calospora MUT 4182 TaxID=1051891 RepID=A0A0C3QWF2_9AGAM|nr:hypothetical protein M407DRAFT_17053 [Tulasnella calospora MUT 4182]